MPGPEPVRRSRTGAGSRPAPQRAGAWRISLALLFCLAVVISGLHTVLQGLGWWFSLCLLVLAILGGAAAARAASRKRWLPTLVGVIVLMGALTVFFAARTAFLFLIPTFDTWEQFGDLVHAGSLSISGQSVPAEVTLGIMFLLCVGIGSIAIVADLIAATWHWPAVAGIPLLVVLAVPASIGLDLSDGFTFALAAVAYLVLLRAGQPLRQTSRSIALGASAVALALILPLALPPVEVSEATPEGFSGYVAGVNPVLNLGADLRRDLPRTVLTYNTQSGSAHYLRLVSLQNFTAETWEPDPPVIDEQNLPSRVGAPPGLAADVAVEDETTWIDVNNLGSPWLPVPYPATSVSGLAGNWFWDAEALTFTSPDRGARGENYRVESLEVQPTPTQLENAGTVLPDGYDKYLALPDGLPAIISDTATQVTAGAASNYEKAVALQEYFRDGGFGYSETAPADEGYDGTGMEVLAKFLVAKSGYCVHFASAMAVMARTLGIPSRVAVGFLPGTQTDELVQGRVAYQVTTQNVHSWPELYFEGIGWTRFEPTPGRGFVPTYADEANPGVPTPPVAPTPSPTSSPSPSASASAPTVPLDPSKPLDPGSNAEGALGGLWIGLALLGGVLLLLLPAIIRALQRGGRMRRLARGSPSASTGWRELLQTADDLGIRIDGASTPREAARRIARSARLGGADAGSLVSALHTVERQSFARPGVSAPGAEQVEHLNRVLRRLRAAAGPLARLRAALAPRSIWSRIGGLFAVAGAAGPPEVTRAG